MLIREWRGCRGQVRRARNNSAALGQSPWFLSRIHTTVSLGSFFLELRPLTRNKGVTSGRTRDSWSTASYLTTAQSERKPPHLLQPSPQMLPIKAFLKNQEFRVFKEGATHYPCLAQINLHCSAPNCDILGLFGLTVNWEFALTKPFL